MPTAGRKMRYVREVKNTVSVKLGKHCFLRFGEIHKLKLILIRKALQEQRSGQLFNFPLDYIDDKTGKQRSYTTRKLLIGMGVFRSGGIFIL